MTTRIACLAAGALFVLAHPAFAQKPDYDRLQGILEKKFQPREEPGTRSMAPPPAPAVTSPAPDAMLESAAPAGAAVESKSAPPVQAKRRENYEWVKTDRSKRSNKRDRSAGGGKSGSWFDSIKEKVWGKPQSSLSPALSPLTITPFIGAQAFSTAPAGSADNALVIRTGGGSEPESGVAQLPVAKKNSYMIQLKPDATEEQIQALLKKYDLKITKVIGALGVITVEQNDPGSTRGLGDSAPAPAPESVTDPKKKLELILDPPLVKALRQESAVDAAFVNSLIGNKSLRRMNGAEVKSGDKTYGWRWTPGETPDGNWGLKTLRMPAVWALLDRHRKANADAVRPKIGIIDTGFTENANVKYDVALGAFRPPLVRPDCETNHGTHVAGIIGARQSETVPGVDGIVPDARIEAVSISAEFIGERDRLDADETWQAQAMLFSDVLANTMVYLTDNLRKGDNLRVVNVSLAYNFVARGVLGDADPDDVEGLKLHIAEQASVIRTMARLVENEVLFVVAAGNDSEDLDEPLHTQWASPFAWAGTYKWASGGEVKNIVVVEATDRDGKRAEFSNTGGHVSAPGVDIMSTLGGTTAPFAVCSGTSQAAPHVAALASILFELDPAKTPAQVLDVLKSTAIAAPEGSKAAPRVDALQSALAVSENSKRFIADIDGNGSVDAEDLKYFARALNAIDLAAATEAPFTEDLNGDGIVDDNECFYPRIDLNGDGQGSVREAKGASGLLRSDLAPIESAWTGATEALKSVMMETGLSARIASTLVAAAEGPEPATPAKCRRRDTLLIAAGGVPATPGPDAGGGTAVTPAPDGTAPVSPETATGGTAVADGSAAGPATAADIRVEVTKGVDELKEANPELKVVINPATGLPISISGFKPDTSALTAAARASGDLSDEDARRIVESFLSTSGLTAALPTRNKQAELKYAGRRKDPDFPNRYIANVEQSVNGVKVFGSSAKLTIESSLGVTRYQGTTSTVAVADTVPTVVQADAEKNARARMTQLLRGSINAPAPPLAMGPNPETAEAKSELTVFDPALLRARIPGGARLSWMVSIDTYRFFVDAKTGEVFHYYRDKPSGLIRRIYDLGSEGTPSVVDEDGKAASRVVPEDAEQAFRYTGAVRDFFFLVFGRNSFDDNDQDGPNGGAPVESYVRYGTVKNAFWCPSKSYDCPKRNVMVFGPGYANAVDIVAHEMVHGIIQHEANLIYSDEPGAVNESIADIFGALIEFYAKGGSGNWLIGENAPGFSIENPLRSLANPNLSSPTQTSLFDKTQNFSTANRGQPDHYGDVLTPDDAICGSTWLNDNGCVHFNSGILNKFAYLIAEGGEHHGTVVKPLGKHKLARLTYRTLTTVLSQTATLVDTAEGYLQACLDLSSSKTSGFTEADCDQVLAAQQAVGLTFES